MPETFKIRIDVNPGKVEEGGEASIAEAVAAFFVRAHQRGRMLEHEALYYRGAKIGYVRTRLGEE